MYCPNTRYLKPVNSKRRQFWNETLRKLLRPEGIADAKLVHIGSSLMKNTWNSSPALSRKSQRVRSRWMTLEQRDKDRVPDRGDRCAQIASTLASRAPPRQYPMEEMWNSQWVDQFSVPEDPSKLSFHVARETRSFAACFAAACYHGLVKSNVRHSTRLSRYNIKKGNSMFKQNRNAMYHKLTNANINQSKGERLPRNSPTQRSNYNW